MVEHLASLVLVDRVVMDRTVVLVQQLLRQQVMLQSCEMFVPAQVPVAFALSIEVVSSVVIDMG